MIKANYHYRELFNPPKGVRYFVLIGGRGAGRSTSATQLALTKLRDQTKYFRAAIMRYVLGDIRNSIFQDILDRIDEEDVRDEITIKEHQLTFECGQNKINGIGFKKSSGDQKSKLKSLANYNCVIIEEADEVQEEDFMQLDDSLRTAKSDIIVILMLNPPDKNHWIIKRWFNLIDVPGVEGFYRAEKKSSETDTLVISTTFRENLENLNESTIRNFVRYRLTKPDYYWNMIRGFVSEGARGRIFKNWKPITVKEYEELPYEETFGLDFGFTNDPTALIGVKKHNNRVWVREYIYETGLTTPMISKRFEDLGLTGASLIFADSQEARLIRELQDAGWNVEPADKGPDSVRAGVNIMLEREFFYTEDSVNVAKETQLYLWRLDKNKEPTNEPKDEWNHAMDGIRYNVYTDGSEGFVGFI